MVSPLLATVAAFAMSGAGPLRVRPVRVANDLTINIYELAQPADLVNAWYGGDGRATGQDPFGVVLWPGALFASRRLWAAREELAGAKVLVMGAGTGLEALTAATLGADVVAGDINRLTLELLQDAAKDAGVGNRLQTQYLDLSGLDPLPFADVYLFCDVFYTKELAQHVARRCSEILGRSEGATPGRPSWLFLPDSQRFCSDAFLTELNDRRHPAPAMEWQEEKLAQFTGSGILVDEDQTYDAQIAFLDLRWRDGSCVLPSYK